MKKIQIKKINFTKEFDIFLVLSTGENILYDFKPKMKTARFGDIHKWEDFKRGKLVDGGIIQWENGVELSLEEILEEKIKE